jgi:transposase
MGVGGMGACLTVERATTKVVFETYVERVLAPSLSAGQVVVMDNLSAHKGERVRELIERRGCELVFLPPYSPNFSPIEEAFSKVKAHLRKAARTRGLLVEAIGTAARRSGRSRPRTRWAPSATVATCPLLKHHENRCGHSGE